MALGGIEGVNHNRASDIPDKALFRKPYLDSVANCIFHRLQQVRAREEN
jgi:hypothetical protein